jgi:hypothetical protein
MPRRRLDFRHFANTGAREGHLCAARTDQRQELDGQPDDTSDYGYHCQCGTDQGRVGNCASSATAPTRLTADVAGPLDQATLWGGRTYSGG